MELVLALILGMAAYEWVNKDDVDPTKHKVVDINEVVDPQLRKDLEYQFGLYTTGSRSRNLSDHKDVKWVFEKI
jgi:hypothetical protein